MTRNHLSSWIDRFSHEGTLWFAKRLSGNDTLANGSHQAGPYVPREIIFQAFPALERKDLLNPDVHFDLLIDSHDKRGTIRAIWYNNKFIREPKSGETGTRNETRLTNFGGRESPLLDPDNTGALAVFVFVLTGGSTRNCHVWVCRNEEEVEFLEGCMGPVEPKRPAVWRPGVGPSSAPALSRRVGRSSCRLSPELIPAGWTKTFPSGEELIQKTRELLRGDRLPMDARLLARRECEYELFQSVEEAYYLPRIQLGFQSIEAFTTLAQTILQSRKSRAGRSLEYHIRDIFIEEQLVQDVSFSHLPKRIDGGKKPDFIFPSESAYLDNSFPSERLRLLAVKTTCKDRWRQVLSEADRIQVKHLLTLQEGVSENQFLEMSQAQVKLVVPEALHPSYPKAVRPKLLKLEKFVAEVRQLAG